MLDEYFNKSLNKDESQFDPDSSKSFFSNQKKVMIHTGSLKILDGFRNLFELELVFSNKVNMFSRSVNASSNT
mgnify:CR=1 FL=1